MKREYLGDSYDAVKRLWQEIFSEWAPLQADSRFIPQDLQLEFTCLTRIPMLTDALMVPTTILNDPDTGIRAPNSTNQREGRTHIALSTIKNQFNNPSVCCVITFDQSKHRDSNSPATNQRTAKLKWLECEGLMAFYYVSHAPFLFAFRSEAMMVHARNLLVGAGIPNDRFERAQPEGFQA